jgi:hypothetical protein
MFKKNKAVFACVLRLPEDRNSASGHENSAQECASTGTRTPPAKLALTKNMFQRI